MNKTNRFISFTLTGLVVLASIALTVSPAQAVTKPKLSIGKALANGSPLTLALTSKYKNKVVTIEVGTLVNKKLKFSKLSTARLNASGAATLCSTKTFPSSAVLRVKLGSQVITETKTKTRSKIAPCPLAAPSGFDLIAESDSGVSSTDHITNATTLTFSGKTRPLAALNIFENSSPLDASCVADNTGMFSCSLPGTPAEGVHSYSVTTSIPGVTSAQSTSISVTVDRTKPTLNWTWVESEIGKGATVHMNLVPSEPIRGLSLSDIRRPAGGAFTMLEFKDLVQTGENYRFTVEANEYEATDLLLLMDANAVTDIAGNDTVGTHTIQGTRVTASPYISLDIYGPVLTSATVETVDALIDYGKVTFTADEKIIGASLDDFSINVYGVGGYGISVIETSTLSRYSLDGILHTDDNQTFWIGISAWEAYLIQTPAESYGFYAVQITNYVSDEYGNLGSASEVHLGPWPEGY